MSRTSFAVVLIAAALCPAASAAQQIDTTIAVRSGGRLEIESWNGPVRVEAWDRSEVRIRMTRRAEIHVSSERDVVTIEPHDHTAMSERNTYEITVPRRFQVEVEAMQGTVTVTGVQGGLTVEALNGRVEISDVGRVDAEAMNGSITIAGARERVQAFAANGQVEISGAEGDIHVEAINGRAALRDIRSGRVEVENVNGGISYAGTFRSDGRYSFTNHSGGVDLIIPDGAGARVRVESYSGRIDTDIPVQVVSDRSRGDGLERTFTFGDGSAQIRVETFSGTIRLRRAGGSL